ncbi:hypothetical protein PFISCL1PPCAC_2052, partial [Pristionchus fissidentatus]
QLENKGRRDLNESLHDATLTKLTLYELIIDSDFLRSLYYSIRVNTCVKQTVELFNCDISRVSRKHFHSFLLDFQPSHISITMDNNRHDRNDEIFWTFSFIEQWIESGVEHVKLLLPRSVEGLNDSNLEHLAAFRTLEMREVNVTGLGIRRLIQAYLLSEHSLPIKASLVTTSQFSLDPFSPEYDFVSNRLPPPVPPDTTIPDSTFYFNSDRKVLSVQIEYNCRYVS